MKATYALSSRVGNICDPYEWGCVSGGTIDLMRPSARALVELQEDSRVFAIRFKRSFWQGLVFGLVSEMDMFDTESLLIPGWELVLGAT